jgi:Sulfotransferase family
MKTAGTSVEIYFEDACIPRWHQTSRGNFINETVTAVGVVGHRGLVPEGTTWYNHMPAKAIRDLIGERIWSRYFKFCTVRNPFDKIVSYWWMFLSSLGAEDQQRYQMADFSVQREEFCRWAVVSADKVVDRHTYMIKGQVCVDHFIPYENLLQELKIVCDRVSYPYEPRRLGAYKSEYRTNRRPFTDYYDADAVAAVQKAFRWELEYFGYQLG